MFHCTSKNLLYQYQFRFRGVRNPMKILDIGFLKTEPTSKFKNRKLGLRSSVFEN